MYSFLMSNGETAVIKTSTSGRAIEADSSDHTDITSIVGTIYSPTTAMRLENNNVIHMTISGLVNKILLILVLLIVELIVSLIMGARRKKKHLKLQMNRIFNIHDISRDAFMLRGPLARHGYDWWWHSFTAQDAETGEDRPFFIEFFICNPALAENEPVLGQLPSNKESGRLPSYLMVKAGTWGEDHCQLHRFFSLKDVQLHAGAPYRVEAADCLACETALKGSIEISAEDAAAHPEWMCDSGSLSWDLTVDKQIAFNVGYGASRTFRGAEAFAMYWHAEGMKSAFAGSIVFNGRKYTVTPEKSYGYADKNWGRDFTSPWVWLSSNCLKSRLTGKMLENSVFDIGGGRPKVFFVPLDRRLLGVFYYEGKEYDFNFSHVWMKVKTEFSFEEREDEVVWHVRQENRHAVMETEVSCLKKDMLLVNYEAPDGSKKHNRLWNGGNGTGIIRLYDKTDGGLVLADEIEATHIGCEYGEYC